MLGGGGLPCEGLASHPAGIEILLVAIVGISSSLMGHSWLVCILYLALYLFAQIILFINK